jgi:hypothetical protein
MPKGIGYGKKASKILGVSVEELRRRKNKAKKRTGRSQVAVIKRR